MRKTQHHPTYVSVEACAENRVIYEFYLTTYAKSCLAVQLPGDGMIDICTRLPVSPTEPHKGPHGWALRRQPIISGPRDPVVSMEIFREMQGI